MKSKITYVIILVNVNKKNCINTYIFWKTDDENGFIPMICFLPKFHQTVGTIDNPWMTKFGIVLTNTIHCHGQILSQKIERPFHYDCWKTIRMKKYSYISYDQKSEYVTKLFEWKSIKKFFLFSK